MQVEESAKHSDIPGDRRSDIATHESSNGGNVASEH